MSYNPFTRQSNITSAGRLNANQTGNSIPKATPVKITSSGIDLMDVSVESDIDAFAGVLKDTAQIGGNGTIVSSGTIENITTSYPVGSMVYISKLGTLTNIKPSLGVNGFGEGDFVIKIGMIAQNVDSPTAKDLLVGIQIMGQL